MDNYNLLDTVSLDPNTGYMHAEALPTVIHLNDEATMAMVDFRQSRPPTITRNQTINDARIEMKACGVHHLLVIDSEEIVHGLISAEDIIGEKPVMISQETRTPRAEIEVKMVMTPQSTILVFDMDELKHAKVGDIVATLKHHKQHYGLVIKKNAETEKQVVIGLFSVNLISKQLGEDVTSDVAGAQSIAQLQHDLD